MNTRMAVWGWQVPIILCVLLSQWLAKEACFFDRQAILQGQYWRLLTAHFVHLNGLHLGLNVLALLVWPGLFGAAVPGRVWLLAFPLLALAISAGIWWRLPYITSYAGLSGVLHGAFVLGACRLLAQAAERRFALLLLLLVLLKILAEWQGGDSPSGALIGGHVLVEAHRYGAFAGVLLALCWRCLPSWTTKVVP